MGSNHHMEAITSVKKKTQKKNYQNRNFTGGQHFLQERSTCSSFLTENLLGSITFPVTSSHSTIPKLKTSALWLYGWCSITFQAQHQISTLERRRDVWQTIYIPMTDNDDHKCDWSANQYSLTIWITILWKHKHGTPYELRLTKIIEIINQFN